MGDDTGQTPTRPRVVAAPANGQPRALNSARTVERDVAGLKSWRVFRKTKCSRIECRQSPRQSSLWRGNTERADWLLKLLCRLSESCVCRLSCRWLRVTSR